MGRSSRRVVECTENAILAVIEQASSPRRPACLSHRDLARDLGVSESRVRHARRRLVDAGLVTVEPRHASDGGQLANGYRLTQTGRERLKRLCAATHDADGEAPQVRSRDPSCERDRALESA